MNIGEEQERKFKGILFVECASKFSYSFGLRSSSPPLVYYSALIPRSMTRLIL